MGRRSVVPSNRLSPEQARRAVIRHFSHLTSTGGANMAMVEAQRAEQSMVQLLVGFALDPSGDLPPTLRAKCAMDVISIARGAIRDWQHTGETIDPSATRTDGVDGTVADALEAAQASADVSAELDMLVAKRVPPEQWPAHVRAVVGDALSYFSERPDV